MSSHIHYWQSLDHSWCICLDYFYHMWPFGKTSETPSSSSTEAASDPDAESASARRTRSQVPSISVTTAATTSESFQEVVLQAQAAARPSRQRRLTPQQILQRVRSRSRGQSPSPSPQPQSPSIVFSGEETYKSFCHSITASLTASSSLSLLVSRVWKIEQFPLSKKSPCDISSPPSAEATVEVVGGETYCWSKRQFKRVILWKA